ncbi:MAG: hypothetical protein AAGG48_01515 [Planctomycetota bacterium]
MKTAQPAMGGKERRYWIVNASISVFDYLPVLDFFFSGVNVLTVPLTALRKTPAQVVELADTGDLKSQNHATSLWENHRSKPVQTRCIWLGYDGASVGYNHP